MSCLRESLQNCCSIPQECVAESFVGEEPANQNLNAALCHVARLSRSTNAGDLPIRVRADWIAKFKDENDLADNYVWQRRAEIVDLLV